MRAAALVAVLLLAGCSASVGPMAVWSDGLGLDENYAAVATQISSRWLLADARFSDATKSGSDRGGGIFASALAKSHVARGIEVGVGGYWTRQVHDEWTKETSGLAVAAITRGRSFSAELWGFGPDGDKIESSVLFRIRGVRRLAPVFEYERVRHDSGTGSRLGAGILWSFGGDE